MIDVSEVIEDSDFASCYKVMRDAGAFVKGRWVAAPRTFDNYGAVMPYNPKRAEYTASGDLISGEMTFYSKCELFTTRKTGISDILEYNGVKYKISSVKPWGPFGYFRAIAERMSIL